MLKHDCDRRRRIGDGEQLQQFVGNALAGEGHEVVRAPSARFQCGGIGFAGAEASVEPEEAENAEVIFSDTLQRIADESDVPATEIVETAEIIEDLAGPRIGGQGIDREVAARGVGLPVIGKCDRRPAAIGRHVPPQRRYFDRDGRHSRR